MNIAFVTSCCLTKDGVGNSIRAIINSIGKAGHDTTVYHMDDSRPSIPNCDAVFLTVKDVLREATTPSAFSTDGAISKNESSIQNGAAHFFSHDLYIFEYLFHYPLLELAAVLRNKKIIFHYNGITPPELFPDSDPYQLMAREALSYHYLLESGHAIIVHSRYMKNYLKTVCPSLKNRIQVMPISVAPLFYEKKDTEPPAETSAEKTSFNLLYVGRLSGNKEIHILVKALHWLKENMPTEKSVKLTIAGAHSRTTTSHYYDLLTSLSKSLNIEEDITFVPDLDNHELKRLYESSDLFVTASIHEGFCIPVAEALCCKTPCVVAHSTASPETMGSGGLSFTPSSPANCGRAIMDALNPSTYARLVANAAEEAKRFTEDYLQKEMASLINETMTSAPLHSTPKAENRPISPSQSRDIIDLLSATSRHSFVYSDQVKGIGKNIIKWLRRKVTLPLEVSTVRTFSSQQSSINKALAEEIRLLKGKLKELENSANHKE